MSKRMLRNFALAIAAATLCALSGCTSIEDSSKYRTAPEEDASYRPNRQRLYLEKHTDAEGRVHPEWDTH